MITSWHVKAFCVITVIMTAVASHRRLDCLLSSLCGRKSKKTSKLYVTGLCEGNLLVTREFPAQRASVAENVSVWWRHHDWSVCSTICVGLHKKNSETTSQALCERNPPVSGEFPSQGSIMQTTSTCPHVAPRTQTLHILIYVYDYNIGMHSNRFIASLDKRSGMTQC